MNDNNRVGISTNQLLRKWPRFILFWRFQSSRCQNFGFGFLVKKVSRNSCLPLDWPWGDERSNILLEACQVAHFTLIKLATWARRFKIWLLKIHFFFIFVQLGLSWSIKSFDFWGFKNSNFKNSLLSLPNMWSSWRWLEHEKKEACKNFSEHN